MLIWILLFSSCAVLCSSQIFKGTQEPKAVKEASTFRWNSSLPVWYWRNSVSRLLEGVGWTMRRYWCPLKWLEINDWDTFSICTWMKGGLWSNLGSFRNFIGKEKSSRITVVLRESQIPFSLYLSWERILLWWY